MSKGDERPCIFGNDDSKEISHTNLLLIPPPGPKVRITLHGTTACHHLFCRKNADITSKLQMHLN